MRRLYDAGVPITLNTDDPGIFGSDVMRGIRGGGEGVRIREAELQEIAENGFRYAFR